MSAYRLLCWRDIFYPVDVIEGFASEGASPGREMATEVTYATLRTAAPSCSERIYRCEMVDEKGVRCYRAAEGEIIDCPEVRGHRCTEHLFWSPPPPPAKKQ